jgi:hypothetical protein
MYVSRLTFHTLPGKTQEVEQKLMTLSQWVAEAGGLRPRVMRTHFGSLGAPDLVFEQEVPNPDALELQIKQVTHSGRNRWLGFWNSRPNGSCTESLKLPNKTFAHVSNKNQSSTFSQIRSSNL